MGNGVAKLKNCCFTGYGVAGDRRESAAVTSEPYDEGLGHSFCYVPREPSIFCPGPLKVRHSEETTIVRSISGAAISANTATPLSTSIDARAGAAFESSTSFSSVPLQPLPRFSGPLSGPLADRGFLSGPIERAGYMSGPLDGAFPRRGGRLRRSFSHGLTHRRRAAASLLRSVTTVISRSSSAPLRESYSSGSSEALQVSSFAGGASESYQWAQGRAGEDRVHVVVSEEHGWLFVGIYDGFNGPDATDYLLSNLYSAVQQEVKGLLWRENKKETCDVSFEEQVIDENCKIDSFAGDNMTSLVSPEANTGEEGIQKRRSRGPAKKSEENQKRWKYELFRERLELDRSVRKQSSRSSSRKAETHFKVLKALSMALKKTEEGFLDIADMIVSENPELALMGSCVLVMVMKGEDVYLMNVGDSRAVLGKKAEPDFWDSVRNERLNLKSINEETLHDLENYDCGADKTYGLQNLVSLQLTKDHSTGVEEEVQRIKDEHPEDSSAIVNDRVKGSLKVTRAFGAGFLKQPKWNNAILEMFRIDYVGTSPYITCNPFLYHHKLSSKDKFLILSSDGLYQYFTNEEAVAEVELFMSTNPEGDPAQHLVQEVLFRAAKNAGMGFYELLEIPQGDRRRYHDDVSIIIISFEGRIWRFCV